MPDVVLDVQAYLVTQTLIDGVTGWPSVRRHMHDDSDQLVALTEDGGAQPELDAASGVGEAAMRDRGVQIRVRGNVGDGDGAMTQAQAIFDALHGLLTTTLGTTEYLRVRAFTEPLFLGFDDNGRPQITMSYRLIRTIN